VYSVEPNNESCKPSFKAIAEGGGRAAKRLAFYFDHAVLAGVVGVS